MKPCTKHRVLELIREGCIGLRNVSDYASVFLDDVRMGLHLRKELLEITGPVDLSAREQVSCRRLSIADMSLMPGYLYLGVSREEISLPRNIIGILNTRSKYARLGLELARSSVYVIPGFGGGNPTPIVFEIVVPVEVKGLSPDVPYGFLTFFELDDAIREIETDHSSRFPLDLLGL